MLCDVLQLDPEGRQRVLVDRHGPGLHESVEVAAAEQVVALGHRAVAGSDEVGAGQELQHQLRGLADVGMRGQRVVASTPRTPPGRDSGSAMQAIEPFCTPCAPAPLTIIRQRASRNSIEQPSLYPIRASAPVPEVKRAFTPREA